MSVNRLFGKIHTECVTHFNPIIANGYPTTALKYIVEHIDAYTRCGLSALEGTGLEYVNITHPSPEQGFEEMTRKSGQRPATWDVATSDLFMVRQHWRYQGTDIYHNIFLPFVRRGSRIQIRGSMFVVHPVLVDRSFSVGANDLFFPFTRARSNILKMSYQTRQDDSFMNYGSVIYSSLYNRSKDSIRKQGPVLWKGVTTLAHYLFCTEGALGAFKKYANVDIKIGDYDTINANTLNMEEWTFFESAGGTPVGFMPNKYSNGRQYFKPNMRLAVRREELTPGVQGLINGFFYVADFFPEKLRLEYINTKHEITMWTQMLGDIIFPTGVNPGKLLEDMAPHFRSLNDYVDTETKLKLQSDDIYLDDFYQLCFYVLDNFDNMILDGIGKVSTMYDKKLEVLKYVAAPVTEGIFKFIFNIAKGKGTITPATIKERLSKFVKPKTIMEINHGHGEVVSASTSSDNMFLKVTSNLVGQTSSSGPTKSKKKNLNDPTLHLDISYAEIGQFAAISKANPSGNGNINGRVQVDSKGHIIRDESIRELTEAVQESFKH